MAASSERTRIANDAAAIAASVLLAVAAVSHALALLPADGLIPLHCDPVLPVTVGVVADALWRIRVRVRWATGGEGDEAASGGGRTAGGLRRPDGRRSTRAG